MYLLVKSKMEILSNLVAFSKTTNFTGQNENSHRFQNFKLDKDPAHMIYLYLGSLVSMRVG